MVEIRDGKTSDLQGIKQLLYQLNQFHKDSLPDDFKSPEEIEASTDLNKLIDDKESLLIVAVQDEQVIGFVSGEVWHRKSWVLQERKIANLTNIFVDESFRGKGIGKALFSEFQERMKSLGTSEIWTEVYAFNKNAHKFYEACDMNKHLFIVRKFL